jgi:hypothetical protein
MESESGRGYNEGYNKKIEDFCVEGRVCGPSGVLQVRVEHAVGTLENCGWLLLNVITQPRSLAPSGQPLLLLTVYMNCVRGGGLGESE